ncbi:RDD family protein [Robertkochia marina]|uniref:RDD family protein n=1 Tax=Robertkochia marina TaxID=1227945 RepID=A0A4S3M0D6_9FLAO|nr:RDD family protein [Robertkochia marina]THD67423.1 RDD family protein [Robertkochia marina]TRZ40763.1 RDD family protein [Robertkochia marina]
MEQILEKTYAKFWDRVGAYILDGIIVGFISFALNYLNITQFKSFLIYLPIAIIGILYKPVMEYKYGATVGKMLLNLRVIDENGSNIDFEKSLLRSLIVITPALLYIPTHYLAFQNSYILSADGFFEFSNRVAFTYPTMSLFTNLFSIVFIVDGIMMASDSVKKRSLKDRMAKTFVIKN